MPGCSTGSLYSFNIKNIKGQTDYSYSTHRYCNVEKVHSRGSSVEYKPSQKQLKAGAPHSRQLTCSKKHPAQSFCMLPRVAFDAQKAPQPADRAMLLCSNSTLTES